MSRPPEVTGAAGRTVTVVGAGVVVDSVAAMFPGVARIGNDLVATFSTVPDGWPGGCVGITRSADDGRTWSAPEILARPAGDVEACLNAVGLTAMNDGSLLLPYNGVRWQPGKGVAGRELGLYLLRSVDQGHAWTGGGRLPIPFHGPCVYGSMVEPGDGRVLWPIWGQLHPGEHWRSSLLESGDGGSTWSVGPTIGYDEKAHLTGSYVEPALNGLDPAGNPVVGMTAERAFRPHSPIDGFTETSVAVLADHSMLAVLRQQGVGRDATLQLFAARSTDQGRTWSAPAPIGFPGMSPLLLTAPGATLLAYRRRIDPDAPTYGAIEVRVGSPEGSDWSEPVALVDPRGTKYLEEYHCGYPAMVPVAGDPTEILALFYGLSPEGRRYLAWNRLKLAGSNRRRVCHQVDTWQGLTRPPVDGQTAQ